MNANQAAQLTKALTTWATEQPSVRAIAIIGSWARAAARPDSDLDVIVLADPVEPWSTTGAWLSVFGVGIATNTSVPGREIYGEAISWRVWFGLDVELELTVAGPTWAAVDPIDSGTLRVAGDGMRILVDKDDLLTGLEAAVADRRRG